MDSKATLVATLGGQPQKVTFLLDLLLARGEEINQTAIVYISSYDRTKEALERLELEFKGGLYAGHPCQLQKFPIKSRHSELFDIQTPEDVEIARQSIHDLLRSLKEQNRRVHIGLSNGRRLLSMIALTAAMQYLTPMDLCWLLGSSVWICEVKQMGGRSINTSSEIAGSLKNAQ